MTSKQTQKGIGLIEVMIALAILLLTALATESLQTSNLISAQYSSVHFSIDHLSSEIIETLRAHAVDANAGVFNIDATAAAQPGLHDEVVAWNARIAGAIRNGEGSINCAAGFCDVSISWMEDIDGQRHRQFYRTRTPL